MKPRGKNVVLGLVIQEKQGTILVPKTHQKSTDNCEVRHIGPDVDGKTLKVGDIVLKTEVTMLSDRCRQGKKYDVMDGDVPCMVVDESDIRLVLESVLPRTVSIGDPVTGEIKDIPLESD